MENKNNLGCGKEFNMKSSSGFICGVPNAWGSERFCLPCKMDMKRKWDEENRTSPDPRIREIHKLRKQGMLNY